MKNEYEVNVLYFIIKLIASLIVILTIYGTVSMLVEEAVDSAKYDSTSFRLEMMDRDFYDRNFYMIYDTLTLYDLTSEEYDQYWELVNGYRDYLCCRAWIKCSDSNVMPDASSHVAEYREKVLSDADSCQFERNRRILEGYAEEITAMQ